MQAQAERKGQVIRMRSPFTSAYAHVCTPASEPEPRQNAGEIEHASTKANALRSLRMYCFVWSARNPATFARTQLELSVQLAAQSPLQSAKEVRIRSCTMGVNNVSLVGIFWRRLQNTTRGTRHAEASASPPNQLMFQLCVPATASVLRRPRFYIRCSLEAAFCRSHVPSRSSSRRTSSTGPVAKAAIVVRLRALLTKCPSTGSGQVIMFTIRRSVSDTFSIMKTFHAAHEKSSRKPSFCKQPERNTAPEQQFRCRGPALLGVATATQEEPCKLCRSCWALKRSRWA